tara:strand:+ start:1396 stop:2034 length:639 start_codon:yes stop_codon:yes gene_type:complete
MSTSSENSRQTNLSSKSVGAGLITAFVASLCCITPVISLLAGIGGIATTFSWMEPFRPFLIALTIGVLGFAWYQKLKPRNQEAIDCACETNDSPSFWQSSMFLGLVTVFAVLMLAFPSYAHIFYSDSKNTNSIAIEQETPLTLKEFKIKGMTCAGCEAHVKSEIGKLAGIEAIKVSYDKEHALVKYDSLKVNKNQIVEAINKTGYTVIEKQK